MVFSEPSTIGRSTRAPGRMARAPHRPWRGIAWLILFLTAAGCSAPEGPRAVEGVLDLRDASLEQAIPLRGAWRARAGADSTAFAAFDYPDSTWATVPVEGYFSDQGFPDDGLVWYRLHLRLPANAPPLRGFLQHANNAHAIYVARPGRPPVEVATSGFPGASPANTVLSRRPVSFVLPSDTSLVLSWKVANHAYGKGGTFYAIRLGSAQAMEDMQMHQAGRLFISFGLYLLIAVFFLFEWLWLRDTRALAIGLLAVAMALRTIVVSGYLELLFDHLMYFRLRIALEAAGFVAVVGLLAFLLWAFFPQELLTFRVGRLRFRPSAALEDLEREISGTPQPLAARWIRTLNTVPVLLVLGLSVLFVGLVVYGDLPTVARVVQAEQGLALTLALPAVVVVAQALERRRPLAAYVAVGLVPVVGGGLHDIALARGYLPGGSYLAGEAFVVFMLIQGFAVARRSALYADLARRTAATLKDEVANRTRELQAATMAAQSANLAKSQFVSAVSHELRTPLASILGYTQVLEEELADVTEQQHTEFFDTIRLSGERLLLLINDLLDIAKIEAGRLDLDFGPVSVRALVEESRAQLYPLAAEKALTVLRPSFEVGAAHVRADEARLRQVLINLLSNAIKFTDSGCVGVRVYETAHEGRPACAIAVFDTGPGISPEFLPHLFTAFAQDSHAYGKTQRGTGLGLAISRELIDHMGGTIDVTTQVGAGSTFTVTLPLADPGRPAVRPHSESAPHPTAPATA